MRRSNHQCVWGFPTVIMQLIRLAITSCEMEMFLDMVHLPSLTVVQSSK
jgi:hypothetical protein